MAVALLISAAILTAMPTGASAATAGPNNAGTAADVSGIGSYDWHNPTYAQADDSSYAYCDPGWSGVSKWLQGTNYGFAVPSGSTINGIQVTIGRYADISCIRDNSVRLIKNGSVVGDDKAYGTNWPTGGIGTHTYGATNDLWGQTWTAADINAANFGVALSAYNTAWLLPTAYVDYMQITVTYTLPTTTTSISATPASPTTYGTSITFTATVTGAAGSNTPSGTVIFMDGATTLGTGTLSGSGLTATATLSTSSLTVGTHGSITAVYGGDSNFLGSTSSSISRTVNPRVITVTADAKSKVYGTADPALTYTYSPALVGSDSFSGTLTRAAGENAGSHAITQGTLSLSSNYTLSYTGAALTITPKALTITASDRGKNYGDTVNFAGTEFTAAGLINSDTVASVTLSSAGADAWASIGTYPIVPSAASGTGLSNYTITYQDGTLTVSALTLTVTANNRSKTYGEAISFAGTEFTVSGLLAGDSVDSVTLTSAGAGAAGAAGTWGIVPSNAVGTGLAKYTITYVNGTLTVSTKGLTITANNQAKTQGDTLVFQGDEFTAMGLVNSDAVTGVTLFSDGAAASALNGEYTILASGAVGTGLANYSITYVNGKLTVSTYGLTITASSGSKTYGDTFTFAGTEFTVSGLLAGDSVDSVTLTSAGAGATAAAGAYTIVPGNATGTGLAKYTIVYANGILIVSPRAMTITADNATKTYGDTLAFAGTEFTVSGLVNSDIVDSVTLTSAGAGATAAAGAFTIVPGNAAGTGLASYYITYANGSLAVSPRALTITADSRTKSYGQGLTFAGTEFTVSGLVNSDNVTAVALASTGADAASPVGSYEITASAATGTGVANYTITYIPGSLAVSPRALTITADSRTKSYGQGLTFAGTEFTVSGLANSDTVTGVTLTSAGADAAAPVGDYAIVPAAAAGTGLENYSITYVNGSLMVRPGIVITASSSSKTYGDTVTFNGTEFTVTGLGGSDTVTGVTLTSDGAGAAARTGTWDIVVSAAVGTGLDNYDITYVNGTLTVDRRALSIAASNASKSGGSTATLTGTEFSTSGLVNGDRVTLVTLTCAGAEASAAGGTYDIVPSAAAGQGLDNYTITYVNGTLTVNKTSVVWSVTSSPTQTVEGEAVTITATIKPTIAWSVTPPSVSNVPEGEDPITYGIQLTPSGAIGTVTFNYFGVMMTANITYTKATGTVTFRDGGTVLGTARLVNGTATLTVTDLPAGSHYITASYDGDDNFEGGTTLAHVHSVQPGPGPNWWLIGGIIAGATALGFLFLLLFLLLRRRRRRRLAAQG